MEAPALETLSHLTLCISAASWLFVSFKIFLVNVSSISLSSVNYFSKLIKPKEGGLNL
jgi:hypothetical protein